MTRQTRRFAPITIGLLFLGAVGYVPAQKWVRAVSPDETAVTVLKRHITHEDSALTGRSLVVVMLGACPLADDLTCVTESSEKQDSLERVQLTRSLLARLNAGYADKAHPVGLRVDTVADLFSERAINIARNVAAGTARDTLGVAFLLVGPVLRSKPDWFAVQLSTVRVQHSCAQCPALLDVTEFAWSRKRASDGSVANLRKRAIATMVPVQLTPAVFHDQ